MTFSLSFWLNSFNTNKTLSEANSSRVEIYNKICKKWPNPESLRQCDVWSTWTKCLIHCFTERLQVSSHIAFCSFWSWINDPLFGRYERRILSIFAYFVVSFYSTVVKCVLFVLKQFNFDVWSRTHFQLIGPKSLF